MSLESALARTEEALARLSAASSGLTMKLDMARMERDQLRAALDAASANGKEAEDASDSRRFMESAMERMRDENAELMGEVRRLSEQLASLRNVPGEGEGEAASRAELVQVKAEYAALDRSFQLLKSQYLKLQQQADQAAFGLPLLGAAQERGEIDRLREENAFLRNTAAAAANDIDRVIAGLAREDAS